MPYRAAILSASVGEDVGIIHMAETGLCADGEQEKLVAEGVTEIGGSLPVNIDGA